MTIDVPGDIVVVHSVGTTRVHRLTGREAVNLAGGVLGVETDSAIDTLRMHGGRLEIGPELLTIDRLLQWTHGDIQITTGTLVIADAAALHVEVGGDKHMSGRVLVAADARVSAADMFIDSFGVLEVDLLATLELQGSGSILPGRVQ